ncbi:MAG: FAD:protein FMN transferase [Actinobacteria bacterium]|nr:MAG: FAD:protein FMN transferase [Actinomycetota bacterium]
MKSSFRAMGTNVAILADERTDPSVFLAATATVEAIFVREESRFTRFREDSELSRVNRSAGHWIRVSDPFAEVVRQSLAGAAATHGLFDPTVLGALEAAGYDRDFAEIEYLEEPGPPGPVACGRWSEVRSSGSRVRLPEGVGLDFGGFVKGWTADLAAEAAVARGLGWALVNAGGDVRVAGDAPQLEVGIEEPTAADEICSTVRISGGALATSSVTQRRWGPGMHHLIDPRIGLPARGPVVQATAWAPTCAAAEISSKRALLEGLSVLDDVPCVLILASGEVVTNVVSEEAA